MYMMSKEALPFERRRNADGTPNSKYVDLLDEGKPIAEAKVCVCFFCLT